MSLLWKTATENRVEMMSLKDLDEIHSGDYCVPMKHTRGAMDESWDDIQEGYGDSPHGKWTEHGGPRAYVNHLSDQIRRNGITEPIRIAHGEDHRDEWDPERGSDDQDHDRYVIDGHHRYLAAYQAGLREVPVVHVDEQEHYKIARRADSCRT